jgi:hypothetical protein
MVILSRSTQTAPPSQASLTAAKLFTVTLFTLTLAGAGLAVFGPDGGADRIAFGLFMAVSVLYLAGSVILLIRGDYILRMFGCYWPLILARADELQRAQRQRAFSFTFITFLSVSGLLFGAHIGVLAMQSADGDTPTGLMPADAWEAAAVLGWIYCSLTLLPQAYLAWTLKPLGEEEAE